MDDFVDGRVGAMDRVRSALRTASSPFSAFGNWGRGFLPGITFGGKRDTYRALGYERLLFPRNYRGRFKRGGIAYRLVTAFPEACWRGGGALYDDEDPQNETKFEKAFNDLNVRMNVWQIFERADVLAQLGRYSIILLGLPGEMDSPVRTGLSEKDLHFLTPYSEDDAFITRYNQEYQSPRWALPEKYSLRRTYVQWPGQMNPPIAPAKPVDYTRVVHVADGLLDDHIFGRPRLEAVWNLLDDLDKVTGGGAEAFWRRADGGTVWNVDPQMDMQPDDKKAIKEDLQKFNDEMERSVIVRGMKVDRLGSEVADIRGPAGAIIDQISATIGIPQRILMGSEMGKLASSKDKSNWDDRVQDRRKAFCEMIVVRPFVDKLINLGILPEPKDGSYDVDWPEMDEMDQGQRVAAAQSISLVNKNSGKTVVTPSELRTIYLGLMPMTEEQTKEASEIDAKTDARNQALQAARDTATDASLTDEPTRLTDAVASLEDALAKSDTRLARLILAEVLEGA